MYRWAFAGGIPAFAANVFSIGGGLSNACSTRASIRRMPISRDWIPSLASPSISAGWDVTMLDMVAERFGKGRHLNVDRFDLGHTKPGASSETAGHRSHPSFHDQAPGRIRRRDLIHSTALPLLFSRAHCAFSSCHLRTSSIA